MMCSITINIDAKHAMFNSKVPTPSAKKILIAQGVPVLLPMLDLNDDLLCLYILQVHSLSPLISIDHSIPACYT